jgi:hypothetical protein
MKTNQFKKGIFYGILYSKERKKIKELLVEHFGKCFWCKIPVIIYPHGTYIFPPDDLATFDHLKSKGRGRKLGENTPKVLSCRKCNMAREYKKPINKDE